MPLYLFDKAFAKKAPQLPHEYHASPRSWSAYPLFILIYLCYQDLQSHASASLNGTKLYMHRLLHDGSIATGASYDSTLNARMPS